MLRHVTPLVRARGLFAAQVALRPHGGIAHPVPPVRMLDPKYALFRENLLQLKFPQSRVIDDPVRTLAYGTDASFYRLIPQLVVHVESEQEVIHALEAARRYRTPVTFRAAGTSLSGQAVTDSVLLKLGSNWRRMRILDEGRRIQLQPGVIAGFANKALAAYNRRLGPDPSSIESCMIGGIVANNSSGMCCGVEQNTYYTMKDLRMVLADGTVLDTGDAASVARFRATHAQLCADLVALAREVQADPALTQLIRDKYKVKCTTGYSLNALVDFTDPVDILSVRPDGDPDA